MKKNELTQEILKELLHYNPLTGIFTWRERDSKWFAHCKDQEGYCKTWNTKYSNTIAGCKAKKRNVYYNNIGITLLGERKKCKGHRLAFLYMTGKLPKRQIDHIDHNGMNNKWDNLREVTNQENQKNSTMQSNNSSGFTGVHWDGNRNKWKVEIKMKGKTIYGGRFTNKEDAIERRKEMNIEYGFHENYGEKR